MYQRLVMVVSTGQLSDAEYERHDVADQLVRDEEEDARQARHDEHHQGGDHGLAPRRPRDLLGLGADLFQELERTDLGHADLILGHMLAGPPAPAGRSITLAVYIRKISGKAPRRA